MDKKVKIGNTVYNLEPVETYETGSKCDLCHLRNICNELDLNCGSKMVYIVEIERPIKIEILEKV